MQSQESQLADFASLGEKFKAAFEGSRAVELMEKYVSLINEIRQLQQEQTEQLKQQIQDLINREEQEAENVKEDGEKTDVLNRVKSVQEQIKAENQQLGEVTKKCEELEKTLQNQRKEREMLVEEEKKVKQDNKHALPKVRYEVQLYNTLTSIRWQYDCGPDEIKGHVCSKNDVKPFSLNGSQVSKFFVSNYLWDMMEED
ncbi:kinetochore protein spc24-like [Ostrea edulis]|uniref:kinetochore protein spc24-like n=1 Tax=Ostrea edulis TaxID=37623 RepID=UPI0020951188|nr:kinetochore protein spc24-like [Ostrea edulis]XP_048760985.1 kinetochore protein spc24-like [Ostrea edulis]XP_056018231.1 kinetochore protein spc24-like [Ostrea edulis]